MADEILDRMTKEAMMDPVKIQSSVVDEFEQRMNEDVALVDPNNTFGFLVEGMSRLTANTMRGLEKHFEQLYPKRAQTYEDLFKHMSDYDYIGLYATPSTTDMIIYIDRHYLMQRAQTYKANIKRAIIPKDTYFLMSDYTFRVYYPIYIDINTDTGNISTYWAPEYQDSLYTLTSSVLENRDVRYKGLDVLTIKVPVHQFEKHVYTENISSDTGFINVYNYPDRFYAIKVWHDPDGTGELDTQMAQTLSGRIYDVNEPTAYVTVKPEYNKVRVSIPQVYFTNNEIGSQIRIEIYTTKGEMNTEINQTEASNVDIIVPSGSTYTDVFAEMPLFTVSAGSNRITGGSNGYGFDEMMDRVVNQSFYSRVPITTSELRNYVEDQGFLIERYRDGITNRVYRCYRTLVDNSGSIMLSSSMRTLLSPPNIDDDEDNKNSVTINRDASYTFLPNRLYSINDETGHADFVDTINGMINSIEKESSRANYKKVARFNNNRYVFCPLHLKLWYTDRYPIAHSYLLTDPSVTQTEFVKANEKTAKRSSVFSTSITSRCVGFGGYEGGEGKKGQYVLNLNIRPQELDSLENVVLLAVFHTSDDLYVGQLIQGPVEENLFQVVMNTNYEILGEEEMVITNFDNHGITNPAVQLHNTLSLYFFQIPESDAEKDDYQQLDREVRALFEYKVNNLTDGVDDPTEYKFLNHQDVSLELGRLLSETHNPVEINFDYSVLESLSLPQYAKYTAPVYKRDEQDVIEYTVNDISDWTFPSDTPSYVLSNFSGDTATVESDGNSDPADIESGMAVESAEDLPALLYIKAVTEEETDTGVVYTVKFNESVTVSDPPVTAKIGEPDTPLVNLTKEHEAGEWIFDESAIPFTLKVKNGEAWINTAPEINDRKFDELTSYFELSTFTLQFIEDEGIIKANVTKYSSLADVNDIKAGMQVENRQSINEHVTVSSIVENDGIYTITFDTDTPGPSAGDVVEKVKIGEIYKRIPKVTTCVTSKTDDGQTFVIPQYTYIQNMVKLSGYYITSDHYEGDTVLSLKSVAGLETGMHLDGGELGISPDTYIDSIDTSNVTITISKPLEGQMNRGTNVLQIFRLEMNNTVNPDISEGEYDNTLIGIPYIKGEPNMPDTDTVYSERSLQYFVDMIQVDAKYLISDEPEHENLLETLNSGLESYFSIVQDIQPHILEVTHLYYMPIKTIGNTSVVIENKQQLFTDLELGVRFKLYVDERIYNSESEKKVIREAIIGIINEYTKQGKFSCAAIARMIEDRLSDRIHYVDIVGVKDREGGYTRPQTLLPVTESSHPVLGNTLTQDEAGDIRLEKDLELDYIPTL